MVELGAEIIARVRGECIQLGRPLKPSKRLSAEKGLEFGEQGGERGDFRLLQFDVHKYKLILLMLLNS